MTDTKSAKRHFVPSLGTRVFLVTSLLTALAVGVAVAVTSVLIRGIATNAARRSLESSASAQQSFQNLRYEQLKLMCKLFTADPHLDAYLAEAARDRDVRSILDLLTTRRSDLAFDFAIVLDTSGKVVARTDIPSASGQDLSQRPLIREAIRDLKEANGVWREGNRLYYAVAVPIAKGFDLIGFMAAGFGINELSAKEVSAVSGSDVAFVANDVAGPVVAASTLPAGLQQSLGAALAGRELGLSRALRAGQPMRETELSLDGEPWLALSSPLRDGSGKPVGGTVALASLGASLAAYRRIEQVLLLSGLAAVLFAPLLSFAFTRRTLGPVRRLVAATEAARQGNYDQRIAADRPDEVGKLARAFDELLSDLREKRDMETFVTELSRNLPEPAPMRTLLGAAQLRQVLLMGIELRGYARQALEADPQKTLDQLGAAMVYVESTVGAAGGEIQALVGHRVLVRFDRNRRSLAPLAAAAKILQLYAAWRDGIEAPAIAIAGGQVVAGPVTWGEQSELGLVGQPVQQLESLLREATSGDIVLSRDVYEELKEQFQRAGYLLAPRRGLVTPQPLYVLDPEIASRLANLEPTPGGEARLAHDGTSGGEIDQSAVLTLSGIPHGAIMGHRFQVLSVLGSGGMGVVYKARDRELDDLVALKMLRRDLWGDRGQLDRLKSELKLARKITHPNVVRTYDFGEIDGVPYISMEYVRGVTLRYMLDQSHRLPYSAGLRLAKQICAGLGAAHAVGVIHRDIKPANLILEPTGNAKLMDFGIARPVTRIDDDGQTRAGFIVGTPQYLAPEQLQGAEADTRADIYSVGLVLYEIFTGHLPFPAPTAMEVMIKQLKDEPPPLSSHWPEVPPGLEAAILRSLRKNPDERFRSVQDLQHELEGLSA
ncbi:MAG TPA: protein kinase [Thermoanaerobaculia bacterium]|nr:protein kinase [Thermoanaerobaculia bacterium]